MTDVTDKIRGPELSFHESLSCPYFHDERIATIEYLFPSEEHKQNFHKFLARGYRRIGSIFYRNRCKNCSACQPLRLETEHFKPGKSQKRVLRKNADVRIMRASHPCVTPQKIELFRNYLESKHYEPDNRECHDYETSLLNVHYGYTHTIEMDYYLGSTLIGVGIVDSGTNSLSSNYFYYDTCYLDRRLGTLSILHEISLARFMRKKYYYLGFYIEEKRKMSYKRFFRPNQLYVNGIWKEFLS